MSNTKLRKVTSLIISDDELNCNCKDLKLEDLNVTHIGFSSLVTDQYDLIIYTGEKGTKILKSTYTKTGIVS